MRGNEHIREKRLAARYIVDSGMNLGFTTTVTPLNLAEVGDIARFGLSLGPRMSTFTFRVATRAGRHELSGDARIDKEQVVRQLLRSDVVPGLTSGDFWPVPHFAPWRMRVHPDCGVCAVLGVEPGTVRRTADRVNMARLYERLRGHGASRNWLARNLVPLYYILSATRRSDRVSVLRSIVGTIRRSRTRGLVMLAVADFPRLDFWDEQRLSGCSAAVLTTEGRMSPCAWYGPMRDAYL
jgi:hypothetical protein